MVDFSKAINWERLNNLSHDELLAVAKALHIDDKKEESEEEN